MPQFTEQQQEAFAQHYALYRNMRKAAEAAGLPREKGREIAVQPAVASRIRTLLADAMSAANITPESVLEQLRRFAFPDVRRLYGDDGELVPIHELDDETASTILSVDVETRYAREGAGEDATVVPVKTIKVRRVDPMPALTLLAKHLKLVGEDGDGVNALAATLADRLNKARERAFGTHQAEDARIIAPRRLAETVQETSDDERLW